MYQYEPKVTPKFDIVEAYNQIAGASFRFEAEGYLDIWIYLTDGELNFLHVELNNMDRFLVAHYLCHKVTHGFSSFEWNKLGQKLARVYLENK